MGQTLQICHDWVVIYISCILQTLPRGAATKWPCPNLRARRQCQFSFWRPVPALYYWYIELKSQKNTYWTILIHTSHLKMIVIISYLMLRAWTSKVVEPSTSASHRSDWEKLWRSFAYWLPLHLVFQFQSRTVSVARGVEHIGTRQWTNQPKNQYMYTQVYLYISVCVEFLYTATGTMCIIPSPEYETPPFHGPNGLWKSPTKPWYTMVSFCSIRAWHKKGRGQDGLSGLSWSCIMFMHYIYRYN